MKVGPFTPLANPSATPEYIEALGNGADERSRSISFCAAEAETR